MADTTPIEWTRGADGRAGATWNEPMLGPLDVTPWLSGIDWVVCGGEKAKDFRPLTPDWSRSLRDQCKEAGVAYFQKQMSGRPGAMPPIPDDLMVREFPGR